MNKHEDESKKTVPFSRGRVAVAIGAATLLVGVGIFAATRNSDPTNPSMPSATNTEPKDPDTRLSQTYDSHLLCSGFGEPQPVEVASRQSVTDFIIDQTLDRMRTQAAKHEQEGDNLLACASGYARAVAEDNPGLSLETGELESGDVVNLRSLRIAME